LIGPKDAGAEQAVALWLEGPIVDRLRLFDFAEGPGKNLLGAGDRDPDGIERLRRNVVVEKIHDLMVHACLLLGL
jgi:hypothetical protein